MFLRTEIEKKVLSVSKKSKKNLNKPGGALENGADVGNTFASRRTKAALSTIPEVIGFYHTGKRL